MCVPSLWKPEERVRSAETGVTDNCEFPCGLGLVLGPLEKQPVLITVEPSPQSP